MRVVIAGGGTGGHFFPGLAVAQALRRRAPEAEVLFVGGRAGIEARLAPRYGFPLLALSLSGFAGRGPLQRLGALAQVPLATLRCAGLCLRRRPLAVVGVGGYASFPMGLAAVLTGTPLVLVEQNVELGLANRVLGRWAGLVAVSFPQTLRRLGANACLTGNPVRADLAAPAPEATGVGPFRLLVFGGSRGARALNQAMVDALPALREFPGGIEILHQAGEEDLERVRAAYAGSGVAARVEPFLHDMAGAYAWCQGVLCRAGATTLAELAAVRRPALLVPFPFAAGGHQESNARGLAELGAARWCRQSELDPPALLEHLRALARPEVRGPMVASLARLARPHAADEIAARVLGEAA